MAQHQQSLGAAMGESDVKMKIPCVSVIAILGTLAAQTFGQAAPAGKTQNQAVGAQVTSSSTTSAAPSVSRTTKAINYRRAGGSTKDEFQGTDLMQGAYGEATGESKSTRNEIAVWFEGLAARTQYALAYQPEVP